MPPFSEMAGSLSITATVLTLFAGFVWWRIDNLERQLTKRLDEASIDATEQRKAIKEFWTERWPKVEVLESEVEGLRRDLRDVSGRLDRMHSKGA